MNTKAAPSTTTDSFALNKHGRIIRIHELMRGIGLSRASVYAYMKTGELAPSIKLGKRAVGWLESDVSDFIASRVAASRVQWLAKDITTLIDSRIDESRGKSTRPPVIALRTPVVGGAA